MKNAELIRLLDKNINRCIIRSKRFIDSSAWTRGRCQIEKFNVYQDALIAEDFEYFTLTKSTKSLIAFRELIKKQLNEDALILVRSIFENYLNCRYLNAKWENEVKNFVTNPIACSLGMYTKELKYDEETNSLKTVVIDKTNKTVVGEQKQISSLKLGSDKKYFFQFYNFLCEHTHCNFSTQVCYLDGFQYTYEKVNNEVLVRLFGVFSFIKIFELVVTVPGEEFASRLEERECYRLVKKTKDNLDKVLEHIILTFPSQTKLDKQSKEIKQMFKKMKESLLEDFDDTVDA